MERDGWRDRFIDEQKNRWMSRRMKGGEGREDGWMDGWMGGINENCKMVMVLIII